MLELTTENLADYLLVQGRVSPPTTVEELAGGVSNAVFRVSAAGETLIVKQARGRLRVKDDWRCSVERIERDVAALRWCGRLLDGVSGVGVPQLLWEDRANFCYAMSAACDPAHTWKRDLLAGCLQPELARRCGLLLGLLHSRSWDHAELAQDLDERRYFDELRLDPYYRQVARLTPELAPSLATLIADCWAARRTFVHGDFSPKNLLLDGDTLRLIDFEVGHFGDPAFDLGFFLTHLALKSLWAGPRRAEYAALADVFWRAYAAELAPVIGGEAVALLAARARRHWGACVLARVDGKSPVEYLSPALQDEARALGRVLLLQPGPLALP